MKKRLLIFSLVFMLLAAIPSFGQNLAVNWDGITVDGGAGTPTSYGWTSTSTTLTWGPANGSGFCRYKDYNVAGGQTNYTWEKTGAFYTSRALMLRWDISSEVNSGVFSFPVTLEKDSKYVITFDCGSGNGSGGGVPVEGAFFSVGVAPNLADTIGMGNVQKQFFTTGVAKEFGSETFTFKSKEAGTYYLKFWKGTVPVVAWEWIGIGNLIVEKEKVHFNEGDTLRVNFQPAPGSNPGGSFVGATVPEGFQIDSGNVYANHGQFSYGWSESFVSQARQRTDPSLGNDPKGNLIQFNRPGKNGVWKVTLAPGAYQVHLVGGDASYTDSKNSFLLNNQVLEDQTPALSNFDEYNVAVAVGADSTLSFTSSDAANNSKICYIEISKFTSSQNTVKNGDFENGLIDWINMGGKVNIEEDPALVLAGSKTLKLGKTASSMVYQYVEVGPGEYVFSALGKEVSPDGAVSSVDIWGKTDNTKLFSLQFSEPTAKQLQTKVSFPVLDTIIIEANTKSGGLDSAYFDNISLSKYNKPVINMVEPVNFQVYQQGDLVKLSAIASFAEKVKFFLDNKLIGESVAAPYGINWNAAKSGTFLLTAVAYDVLGDSVVSEPVSIEVQSVSLIKNSGFESGLEGWEAKGGKINIENDPALVIAGSKSLKLGPMVLSRVYNHVFAEAGQYVLSGWAKQQAADGSVSSIQIWNKSDNIKLASIDFSSTTDAVQRFTKVSFATSDTIIVELLTGGGVDSVYFDDISLITYNAPTVLISTPEQNQIFGMTAVIPITAEAANAVKVRFFANENLIGETLSKPYSIDWDAPLGSYQITAAAFDVTGDSVVSEPISIIKQTEKNPPTSISRLQAIPYVNSVVLKWSAATDASGIKGYIIYVNDVATDTVPEFTYTVGSL